MVLNILSSASLWIIILIIFIITASVIIFLTLTEKILKRKVVIKQQKEDNSPARRIKLLISTKEDPQNKLRKINLIAKEIFRDSYNLDTKTSYYELADKFQKQGKKNHSKFCQEMFKILYSGEELQLKKTEDLVKLLEKINSEVQEDKNFKKLEKSMRDSIRPSQQKISLFAKFTKAEDKLIDKFAKEKKLQTQEQQIQPTLQAKSLPTTPQIQTEYKTKRQRLQNLPLIKLFRFGKTNKTILTSQEEQIKQAIKESPRELKVPVLETEKESKEKSTYQEIEDLQKEIIEREKHVEKLRTAQQIQNIERNSEEIEVNKNKTWPPISITPKHLGEIRKMSPQMESSFQKANKEINLLENEIKIKQKEMKKLKSEPIPKMEKFIPTKSSPIIKKFLKTIGNKNKKIEKEILKKQKQIHIINIKKEPYPTYNVPEVKIPKRYKIEEAPKNKPLKKEEFIHHVDNMERIKSRIHSRRAGI